jgi:hypothetical protein
LALATAVLRAKSGGTELMLIGRPSLSLQRKYVISMVADVKLSI